MNNCILLESSSTLDSHFYSAFEADHQQLGVSLLSFENSQNKRFCLLVSKDQSKSIKNIDFNDFFKTNKTTPSANLLSAQDPRTATAWLFSQSLDDFLPILKLPKLDILELNYQYLSSTTETNPLYSLEIGFIASDTQSLRQLLGEYQQQHKMDFILIEGDHHHSQQQQKLICFDMDSTLIKTEVIDELAICAGVGEQVAEITERAMQGELDFKQSFAQRMALLEGLPIESLEQVAAKLPIMDGLQELMTVVNEKKHISAILSGGFDFFAQQLQQRYGFNYIFTNKLDFQQQTLTGKVIEPVVDGERKAALLKQLARQESIDLNQTIAVGDGANDLAMIQTAGIGVAYKAKKIVRLQAPHSILHHGLNCLIPLL